MEWLHDLNYWRALLGALSQIGIIAIFTAGLRMLWKKEHAWGTTLAFVLYVVLFILEPPASVQAYMNREEITLLAALRSFSLMLSLALFMVKIFRLRH